MKSNGKSQKSKYEEVRLSLIRKLIPHPTGVVHALDIGCGKGCFSEILENAGYQTSAIDLGLDRLMCARARVRAIYLMVNAEKLAFKDSCFDLILALEIFEHLHHPSRMLEEIRRVSKPDATIIISTPNVLSITSALGIIYKKLKGEKWTGWDERHVKLYSSFNFKNILEKYFIVERIVGYSFFPASERLERLARILDRPMYAYTSLPAVRMLGFSLLARCKKRKGPE